jgi:hypothetical protein
MKRTLAAFACSLTFVPLAHGQVKDSAVVVDQVEAVVTVTKVDQKARTVSFRGPKGGVATLNVPPEAQNLDKVKPGQQYKMKYVEAVAVGISKGGEPSAAAGEQVKLAPKGANPGGMIVRAAQLSGVVDAVDYKSRYIAVRGPKGNVVPLKVADDVPLEQLSAGDRITLAYTQALALDMVAQAPAKKKPAAKTEK